MDSNKKTINIWFNHWFSSAYHLINLLKENPNFNVRVIGSNKNEYVVYRNVCDEWYQEPSDQITASDYVDFAVNFCKEKKIDIFFPRRFQMEIVKNKALFDEINVKLFAESDYKIIELAEDKAATYDYLSKVIPEVIPDYRIAHSLEEFASFYKELIKIYDRICYKLTIDEGAMSFRVIDDDLTSIKNLLSSPGHKLSFNDAYQIMSQYDFSVPVLLMPYLDGVEVSVDCLKTNSGNIVIPRFKTNKRYLEIYYKSQIIEYCNRIIENLHFEYPLNIQFKKSGDTYYLLEINSRMSGGLQLSLIGSNVNIPSIALSKAFGIDDKYEVSYKSAKVVHIESPIKFN